MMFVSKRVISGLILEFVVLGEKKFFILHLVLTTHRKKRGNPNTSLFGVLGILFECVSWIFNNNQKTKV